MPPIGSAFRTAEPLLHELLEQIHRGAIQLPDFQRGWVWDDDHIRSLIASISLSYPIGAVMLLETGSDNVRFKPRGVEGVELRDSPHPDRLILDGQQRLTSLYLALQSGKPIPTWTEKGQEIKRVYYLDMRRCLDPESDRLDAIISLPPDRIVRSDFARQIDLDVSTREQEYEHGFFPLSLIFDPAKFDEWKEGYQEYFDYAKDNIQFLNRFSREIWQRFQQYKVPVIELLRDTEKEAVCQVFEKVNTGGVTLSVFELVTATFAADDFQLRQEWSEREERLHAHGVLQSVDATAFLTALTLLTSYQRHLTTGGAVSCKRRDVLKLTLDEYRRYADPIEKGLIDTARLLAREKIFDMRSLPYTTQLIPLSAICAVLEARFEQEPVKRKLVRWFWCGVFGELYGGANETRYAFDPPEVVRWIEGGDEPRTIRDASFNPTRLLSLQSRQSAAYKGVMALLMQEASRDFINGDPIELTSYFDLAIDIHHIFPRAYCEKQGLQRTQWNSVINKAPLSSRTNRIIGGRAPSSYLASLMRNHGMTSKDLDTILQSHLISGDFLWHDDFKGFFQNRAAKLLDAIENAMGKTVLGRDANEVVHAFGGPLQTGSEMSMPGMQGMRGDPEIGFENE
jgi:hypothetical protein